MQDLALPHSQFREPRGLTCWWKFEQHSAVILSDGLDSLMLPVEAAGAVTGKTPGCVPKVCCPCLPAAAHIPSQLTHTEVNNAETRAAVLNITTLGALKKQR